MRNQSFYRNLVACVFAGSAFFVASAHGAKPGMGSFDQPGITSPSEQRGLNFNTPGVVSKVMVKEGDAIKKGDVLAQQDDSVELAELAVKQEEAEGSKLQITAAEEDLAEKKIVLARQQKMLLTGATGKEDVEKADLDVKIGTIRVTLAEVEAKQKEGEVATQKAKIAQKKLLATIDGSVEKINVHEGELAANDPKTPCMQVVSNEPLYLEVDLPVAAAAGLQLEQKLDARYLELPTETKWHEAKIIFFPPRADPKSSTQRVRLQLDNPNHLRSGVQMEVAMPDAKHEKAVAAAAPAR